ncbi:hypothetical protein EV128_11231 [Rhizobium azibense]|nr:hypothetical protein EV128_11231 [Rhizobium azibense]
MPSRPGPMFPQTTDVGLMAKTASTRSSRAATSRAASAPFDVPAMAICLQPRFSSSSIAWTNVSSGTSQVPGAWPSPPNQRRASDVAPMLAKSGARGTSTRPLDPARTRVPLPSADQVQAIFLGRFRIDRSGYSSPLNSLDMCILVFGRGQPAFPNAANHLKGARSSVRIGNTL